MESGLEQTVEQQRVLLSHYLQLPMTAVARRCAEVWLEPERLQQVLAESVGEMPLCHFFSILDPKGVQITGNIGRETRDASADNIEICSLDRTNPASTTKGFLLSDVHVHRIANLPCLTAIQAVINGTALLGFVAADFYLRDLPLTVLNGMEIRPAWIQIRGDPAIRQTLFMQERVKSAIDERMDDVIAIMEELICERGIFHGKLHYSSSRATLWFIDDPYRYRLHGLDEITNPELCLAYPIRLYPAQAAVPQVQVRPVFEHFRLLRDMDKTVYLRSGSLNIMNGMVGLNFSCDGSHYMPVAEFLEKDERFWFGKNPARHA